MHSSFHTMVMTEHHHPWNLSSPELKMFVLKYTTCREAIELRELYRSPTKEDTLHGAGSLTQTHHYIHPNPLSFII